MDRLEELYRTNKQSLDQLEPKKDSWDVIQKSVTDSQYKPVKKLRFSFYKMAAVIIVLVGLLSIFLLSADSQESSIYSTLAEASNNHSLINPEGEPAKFDPTKNKYTLVQFWSSGNALCIEENCYHYLPAYEKFKDKGFEIYAVSLDSDLAEWISGIEENELPWLHASDLKGWESPICVECNITSIPSSFLLDNQGKVLAKNMDASQLEVKLEKLFAEK